MRLKTLTAILIAASLAVRGRRAGAAAADAIRAALVLRTGGAARGAGGGQRLRRQGGAEPQSAPRRSDLSPLLRRAREEAATSCSGRSAPA